MEVHITESAWDDLLEIARTIQQSSPKSANAFLDDIYDRCMRLGSMPYAFPVLPDRDIRRFVFGNYLAFFRVADHRVQVLRFIHGARDYERLLFPES